MAKLRVIEVSGTTALERGTAYGRAAADPIGQAITYQMLLSSAPGPGWKPERVAELRAAFAGTESTLV